MLVDLLYEIVQATSTHNTSPSIYNLKGCYFVFYRIHYTWNIMGEDIVMKKLLCMVLALCLLAFCARAFAEEEAATHAVINANVQVNLDSYLDLYQYMAIDPDEEMLMFKKLLDIVGLMDIQLTVDESGNFRMLLLTQGQQVLDIYGMVDMDTQTAIVASDLIPHHALKMAFDSGESGAVTTQDALLLQEFFQLLLGDLSEVVMSHATPAACDLTVEGVQFVQKIDVALDNELLAYCMQKGLSRLREYPRVVELMGIETETLTLLEADIESALASVPETSEEPEIPVLTASELQEMMPHLSPEEVEEALAIINQPVKSLVYTASLYTSAQGDVLYMTLKSNYTGDMDVISALVQPDSGIVQIKSYNRSSYRDYSVSPIIREESTFLSSQVDIRYTEGSLTLDEVAYMDEAGTVLMKLHLDMQALAGVQQLAPDFSGLTVLDADNLTAEEKDLLSQDIMQYGFPNVFVKLTSLLPAEAAEFLSSLMAQ